MLDFWQVVCESTGTVTICENKPYNNNHYSPPNNHNGMDRGTGYDAQCPFKNSRRH